MPEKNNSNWSRSSSLPEQRLLLCYQLGKPYDVVVNYADRNAQR
jgi:hypothetical protein